MRRTCLSATTPAHNVSQEREVFGVDGAVFVAMHIHDYPTY